jgi:hypothetical protein
MERHVLVASRFRPLMPASSDSVIEKSMLLST